MGNIQKGKKESIGNTVVVIGGGFSAVDAARTCVRMGASDVFIAYRRTREEMPASVEEIREAEEEGVKIMYLVSPKVILEEAGKICGIRLVNYVLGDPDDSNRRKPLEIEGTEFTLKVDTVISALGQKIEKLPDDDFARMTNNGLLEVDSFTFKTKLEDVYAVGDAALGAGDIISAIASGKKAAAAVDNRLRGKEAVLRPVRDINQVEVDHILETRGNVKREASSKNYIIDAADRINNFYPYTRTFSEEEAIREAGRCLNCGCGEGCLLCVDLCNSFAISNDNGKPLVDKEECVGCGICVWRCPIDNLEMIETH